MKVVKTSIDNFDEDIIFEAINVLARGGVVLYPTDTVYGLGANIFDNKAVRRIFDIKQRSFLKPISILVRDIDAIDLVAKTTLGQKKHHQKLSSRTVHIHFKQKENRSKGNHQRSC